MKLSDYMEEAVPLTVANFINLRGQYLNKTAFNKFCERMNKEGGYGALDDE